MPKQVNITNNKTGEVYSVTEEEAGRIMNNQRTSRYYSLEAKAKKPVEIASLDLIKKPVSVVRDEVKAEKEKQPKTNGIKGTDRTEKQDKIEKGNVKKATDKNEKIV